MITSFNHKKLFIVGTDTGVGKTLVTAALAAYLSSIGYQVGVMKPLESGCSPSLDTKGQKILIPQDALYLQSMSQTQENLDQINPYRFEAPLAPGVAADIVGVKVDLDFILQTAESMTRRQDIILIEGAGGLMVPLSSSFLGIDLIEKMNASVLLVGRAGLGTINHCLLTLSALENRNIPVVGILLNHTDPKTDLSSHTNLQTLSRWTSVPVWGEFSFLKNPLDRLELIEEAKKFHPYLKSLLDDFSSSGFQPRPKPE